MLKVGISFVAAYLLLVVVAVTLFLFIIPVETTKGIYASIPSSIFGSSIRRATISGHFAEAGELLARQAVLSERMGLNDSMKQNLVSQTFDVVDRARNKNQFEDLLKWLERLNQISPNNLLANLMLNDALIRTGRSVNELKLREIREIAPSLDAIYRSAIEQAVRRHDNRAVGRWCGLYQVSQLGVLNPEIFKPSRVKGQGLNGFFLEVVNRQGDTLASTNFGIQLNERRSYEFETQNIPRQSQLGLQLPTLPGLKVTVHKINFVKRGATTSFAGGDLVLLPKRGFIVAKNQSLITSSAGDTLIVYPQSGRFPPSDKIVLELEFVRLAVANHSGCITDIQ